MRRTLFACAVGASLLVPLAILSEDKGIGSWGDTGICLTVLLIVSLIDREGFYGPRDSS